MAKGLVDAPPVNLRDEGLYGLTVVLAPHRAWPCLITIGLRYLFTLPVAPACQLDVPDGRAEDRHAWLAAVERFVVLIGIVPVFAARLPASIAILGPCARTRCHRARIRRLADFLRTLLPRLAEAALHLFLPAGQATGVDAGFPRVHGYRCPASRSFAVFVGVRGSDLLYRARFGARRLMVALAYAPPARMGGLCHALGRIPAPEIEALNLDTAKGDDAPLSAGPARPSYRDFGGTLVASRGILPAAGAGDRG